MVVFRFLFWTWFVVSLAVLVYRLATRSRRAADDPTAAGAGSGPEVALVERHWGPPPEDGQGSDPSVGAAPDPALPPEPTAAQASASTPADPAATVFDPPPTRTEASVPRARSVRPIADVLHGIAMPVDLVPLLDAERHPGAVETVAFVTSGREPGAVGEAMGTELRGLGFDLAPVTSTHVVASREGEALHVEVHGEPRNVERGGMAVFPSAREGQVVVEIWRE